MGLKWIQAFNTAGEDTTLTQMNYGTTATVGNFRPPVDGAIKKVVIFIGSEAATSLVEDVRVELESTDWTPNRQHFLANGSGLRAATTPQHFPFEYDTDLVDYYDYDSLRLRYRANAAPAALDAYVLYEEPGVPGKAYKDAVPSVT